MKRLLGFGFLIIFLLILGLSSSTAGTADERQETVSTPFISENHTPQIVNAPPVVGDCDYGLPEIGASGREDVLIIVNDNSIDSCEAGAYYAQERALGWKNICHVKTRPGYFISWHEFEIMRDQIISYMQENTLANSGTPVVCSGTSPYYCEESMEQLREHTKIRYIVTTRGVPTRMKVDNSSLWFASSPTSVDNYLRYWLINYFDDDVDFWDISDRPVAFEDGRGMREVDPSIDNELIIGRIDGIDLDSAKALVDRAINAENNGIYGKLYSAQMDYHYLDPEYSPMQWIQYGSPSYSDVYGSNQTAWRYQHGLFGKLINGGTITGTKYTSCEECLTHIENSQTTASGKSPQECVVKLTSPIGSNNLYPGAASSRQPIPDSALVYLGYLDGQQTTGSFNNLLNWRRDSTDQCPDADCGCEPLCENTTDPSACRAASTDPFQEINTECVGVADGFLGYNFVSWPVSYLTVWPTGWGPVSCETNYMAFPEIRDDEGYDDSYSMWFRNMDQSGTPSCYADSGEIGGTPTATCFDERTIYIEPVIDNVDEIYDSGTPQQYQVSFWYRGENIKTSDAYIRVYFQVHEKGSVWASYPYQLTSSISTGDSTWTYSSNTFEVDPAQSNHSDNWDGEYDRIRVRLQTSKMIDGELGFDVFSINDIYNGGTELAQNNSFTEGHKQTSSGDHAANFLSRLNGTAFWGSLSHHQSGGYSFSNHGMETLIYFFRGLPLGDAVWFADSYNSGVLYGDPLYSPVAVYLHYSANEYDFFGPGPLVELFGDTINGNDPAKVDTAYSVEYGPGEDFFVCDQQSSWQSTGITGIGGTKNMSLGQWDISLIAPGSYTLRLSVTGTNNVVGLSQTFYDYYPIALYDATSDFDKDGITDIVELSVECLNPRNPDTDADGLMDGEEDANGDGIVDPTETDPCDDDTDNDGMPDGWESQCVDLDPLINDADEDPDDDDVSNIQEYYHGISPCDDDSDADEIKDGIEVGSCTDPANDDSDGDCMLDGEEDINHDGDVDYGETDPCDTDTNPWVDDDWVDGEGEPLPNGTIVQDPKGFYHEMGCDAYARIQDAVDPCMGLFTINVAPGTYCENIAMKKGLILQGANVDEGEAPQDYVIDGGNNGAVISAIEITEGVAPQIAGFRIINGSSQNGGGMYNSNSSPVVTNCIFTGNSSDQDGGGMYNIASSPTVTNCIFTDNLADQVGGGICNINSSPTVTNCIFTGNSASNGMAVACNKPGSPSNIAITNCILWDGIDEIYNNDNSTITVSHSDFDPAGSGTYVGTNNISADPLWVNPNNEDFHLMANSPCIDSGTNSVLEGIIADFEGDNRILDGSSIGTPVVDMGVDEYGINVDILITLQGDNRSIEGWAVPIEVCFFPSNSGTLVMSGTSSANFWFEGWTSGTIVQSVTIAYFHCQHAVAPGTYDITADSATTLLNVKRSVDIF